MKPYITVALTARCNLRCLYCPPQGETYLSPNRSIEMSDLRLILKAAKTLGIEKVRYTGGEPFLHPALRSGISEALDLGLQVHVNTNGLLLLENLYWLEEMPEITVKVSLDALSPATFHRLSGSRQLARVFDGIRGLVQIGMSPRINMVVTRHNYREVWPILSFCRDLDIGLKILDIFVVPETEMIWRQLYVPPKALGICGEEGPTNHYTMKYGIPTDELLVNNVHVRIKDSSNGTHYHHTVCESCPQFPCQEGLYCMVITPSLTVIPCRLGTHLFQSCSSFGEIRQAISQVVNVYEESQSMNLFWEKNMQFYEYRYEEISAALTKG